MVFGGYFFILLMPVPWLLNIYTYSSKMNFICGYPDIYFIGEPFPEFETSTELYDWS